MMEKGKAFAKRMKRAKVGAAFGDAFPLSIHRRHARTTRNDFPVIAAPA